MARRLVPTIPGTSACLRPSLYRSQRRYLNASTSTEPFPEKLAFAFDIDGVLKQGPNVLPQAIRALDFLSGNNKWSRKIPYLLVTNGGGVVDEERRRLLSSDLGQKLTSNQLVQSHTPLRSLVSSYADKHVLVLGTRNDACRKVANSYGMKNAWIAQDIIAYRQNVWPKTRLTEEDKGYVRSQDFSSIPFSAIFVMHDSHDWGRDITLISELLSSENGVLGTRRQQSNEIIEGGKQPKQTIPLTFSNADLEWQSDYPLPRFGQGAFRLATEAIYKATTGLDLEYTQLGKPHKATYEFAHDLLRKHVKEIGRTETGKTDDLNVYMVGDNPESDIAGANAYGWQSILLRTGVYRTGKPRHTPSVIVDDVELAVEWAVRRETEKKRLVQ